MKLILFFVLGSFTISLSATDVHNKSNRHHEKNSLSLNAGKKWIVDQVMKTNIDSINTKLSERKLNDPKFFEQLEITITKSISEITKNCKMPPKQDEAFHVILTELIEVKENLTIKAEQDKAIENLKKTLKTYSLYFEHPLSN